MKNKGLSSILDERISYLLMDLSTFLIIGLMFIPQLNLLPMRSHLIVGLMFLCLFITFINVPVFLSSSKYNFLFILYLIYTAIIPLFYGLDVITNRYLTLAVCPFFYVLYKFNRKYRQAGSNLKFIWFWIPFLIYVAINTFIGLMKYPYLTRVIKSSGAETELLRSMGYGGYELIYSVLLLTVVIFMVFMERKKLNMKFRTGFVLFFSICFFIFLVIYSNYFTAMNLLLGSMAVYTILYHKKYIAVFIPLLVLYFAFFTEVNVFVVDSLAKITPSEGKTYFRLMEIRNYLEFGMQADGLNTRESTTLLSIHTFLDNPVGGHLFADYNTPEHFLSGIGQHSFILDTLAIYGIVAGIPMVFLMVMPFINRIKGRIPFRHKLFALVAVVCFILIIGTNNLTPTIGFVAFFVFPAVYDKMYALRANVE